ncbi:MAG: tyrosine-type recombinase/integrase [Halorientalis sp.]
MAEYAQFESIEEFEEFYRDEIVPAIRGDDNLDVDPATETPPYRWLKRNYSGFVERLRREFDLSPGQFYTTVGLPPSSTDEAGTEWGLDHDLTVQALAGYIDELDRDRGRAETTVSSRRSRLKTYAQTYTRVHDRDDLLGPLMDEHEKPAEIQRAKDVFRELDDELGTLGSKRKYVSAVQNWYTFLEETGRALYNPASNLRRRFGWDREPVYDHPALSPAQLESMLAVGDTDERYLLLALAGWGLRPVEACELHTDQLVLEPDDGTVPYIEFAVGERKNARRVRNTVELLVGVDAIAHRSEHLLAERGTGYLFPSPVGEDRPITTQTARRWFQSLGERAEVTVDEEPPKPKMGRRTWYRLYRQQRPRIQSDTETVAASQGSRDASVSEHNYLDERTRRESRADAMRELVHRELASIFDAYLPP